MNKQNLHVFNMDERSKKIALIVVVIKGKKYIDAISLKVEGKTLNRCYHKNVSLYYSEVSTRLFYLVVRTNSSEERKICRSIIL